MVCSSFLKKVLMILFCSFLCLTLFGSVFAQDGIPEEAAADFEEFLEKLEKDGLISSDGDWTYYGDYVNEWAQIGWYRWISFENAERFVLSTNVSWDSASQTPNNFESGCGIVFNEGDDTSNHLLASIRMDGLIYFTGLYNNNYLSYGNYKYGRPSIKGSADFVLVVDRDRAVVYIDGDRVVTKANLQVMGDGVGLSTLSGTNKDFGTRCSWKDIFFYSW